MFELYLRRSHRVQGLPPYFPPIVEESTMKSMDQPITTDSHVERDLVMKDEEEFTSDDNPC